MFSLITLGKPVRRSVVVRTGKMSLSTIFEGASALELEAREKFLMEVCEGNEELRREVDAMLAADIRAGNFLETPPEDFAAAVLRASLGDEAEPPVPAILGHYRLV